MIKIVTGVRRCGKSYLLSTLYADWLRVLAVSLKDETATLLNYIDRLESIDFNEIANVHSKQYYSRFQEASENLNPHWKR